MTMCMREIGVQTHEPQMKVCAYVCVNECVCACVRVEMEMAGWKVCVLQLWL